MDLHLLKPKSLKASSNGMGWGEGKGMFTIWVEK